MMAKLPTPSTTSEDFCEAILELRNTPNADGRSPNEIVFGKNLRSRVPAHYTSFDERWRLDAEKADAKKAVLKEKAAAYYDSGAKDLTPFVIGTQVRIQDPSTRLWDKIGEVVAIGSRRTYRIKLPSGRVYWRNRRFLRKVNVALEDVEDDANAEIREKEAEDRDKTVATDADREPAVRHGTRTRKRTVRFEAGI